mmetsp:Transcript_35139/g.79274  ORF Transcript_35139/g.79274 Transcript_35139/m.79274 type:complete len:209 (-) Transcript_35139:260-886(-)
MFPPCPRQSPLLAVGEDGLRGIKVGEDVPVHDLELLAQPLGIESAAIADHAPRPRFLGCRNHRARGDGQHSHRGVAAILEDGDDVETQGPVYVGGGGAVLPRERHLDPLRRRLLRRPGCYGPAAAAALRSGQPLIARQLVPTAHEALLRAVVLVRLSDIPELGSLVRVEDAWLDDRPAQPSIAHMRTVALVLEEAAIPILEGHVDGHL